MEVLQWLEDTSLAIWVRDANTILAYPTILFLHTLGLATVAGLSAFVSLRVLGFARTLPFAALTPFITAIWVSVCGDRRLRHGCCSSPMPHRRRRPRSSSSSSFSSFFGAATLHLMTKQVFRNPLADQSPLPRQAHVLAVSLMLCWVAATTAGRLMAYLSTRQRIRMTLSHLHLVLNHVPVIGSVIAFGLLLLALVRRSADLRRAGLEVFVLVGLLSLPAYLSGARRAGRTRQAPRAAVAWFAPTTTRRCSAQSPCCSPSWLPGSACGRRAGSPVRLAASSEPSCCSPSSRWR